MTDNIKYGTRFSVLVTRFSNSKFQVPSSEFLIIFSLVTKFG